MSKIQFVAELFIAYCAFGTGVTVVSWYWGWILGAISAVFGCRVISAYEKMYDLRRFRILCTMDRSFFVNGYSASEVKRKLEIPYDEIYSVTDVGSATDTELYQ